MGRAYVAQLLDRGVAKVYAAARDPQTINVADDRVVPLQLDVASPALIDEAAWTATDVSVLINNAGMSDVASVLSKDSSALRALLETNLLGLVALASQFADRIADRSGAIVNVSLPAPALRCITPPSVLADIYIEHKGRAAAASLRVGKGSRHAR
jgi:NAD(P)-dependent dehydrogenase (short-subunit alcohol dehydrogenase family)